MYQSNLSSPLFAKTMNRKGFRDITPYLHVCDNMQLGNKVSPIYVLNNTMQSFGVLYIQLSNDESLVPYNSFVESQ